MKLSVKTKIVLLLISLTLFYTFFPKVLDVLFKDLPPIPKNLTGFMIIYYPLTLVFSWIGFNGLIGVFRRRLYFSQMYIFTFRYFQMKGVVAIISGIFLAGLGFYCSFLTTKAFIKKVAETENSLMFFASMIILFVVSFILAILSQKILKKTYKERPQLRV